MDKDKLFRWKDIVERFYGKDFMAEIFDDLKVNVPNFFAESDNRPPFPHVDLYEGKNEFIAVIELPGMEKEDMELTVLGDRFKLKGTVPAAQGRPIISSERFIGPFERTIQLPSYVNKEGVSARFKNGLLEIHFRIEHNRQEEAIRIE